MPKMRTHSGTKKRLKRTGTGKLKRQSAFTGHLFRNKSKKAKRHLRKSGLVSSADYKRIKHQISNIK